MNYILTKHDYPMLVIRSKAKKQYLDALGKADKNVGPVPSDGAHASLEQARDFIAYISQQMENTLEANLRFLSEKADSVWWLNGEFVTSCWYQPPKKVVDKNSGGRSSLMRKR